MIAILLAVLLALLGDAGPHTLAPEPEPQPPSGIGIGIPWQNQDEERVVEQLQPNLWTNWRYNYACEPGNLPMVWRVDKDHPGSEVSNWDDAVEAANKCPDKLWLLGNEPEWPQQSNTEPEVFAASVREWQRLTDNPIALPGIVVSEYINWQPWAYWYLHHGGPIGDYHHIHIYAGTPSMFENAYMEWVRWMEINDVVRPVIVSETSAVQYPTWMHVWMLEEMPRLLEELPHLKAVLWYSSRHFQDDAFSGGDLLNPDYTLTEVGRAWMAAQQVVGAEVYVLYLPSVVGVQ